MANSEQSGEKLYASTAAPPAKDDVQASAEGTAALPSLGQTGVGLLQVAASKIRKLHRADDEDERIDLNCLEMAGAHMDYAPTYLKRLLRHANMATATQIDVLHLLLYAVALEQGYVAQNVLAEHASEFAPVPITGVYHAKNVLLAAHYKPNFICEEHKKTMRIALGNNYELHDELRAALEFQLSCILTGDLVLITLTSTKRTVPGFSTCLNVERFVTADPTRCYGSLLERLNHLDELSFKVRDELFVPMRNQQLQAHDLYIFPGFTGLPVELYDLIIELLGGPELNSLARASKYLNEVTQNSKHYKLAKRQLGDVALRRLPTLNEIISMTCDFLNYDVRVQPRAFFNININDYLGVDRAN